MGGYPLTMNQKLDRIDGQLNELDKKIKDLTERLVRVHEQISDSGANHD